MNTELERAEIELEIQVLPINYVMGCMVLLLVSTFIIRAVQWYPKERDEMQWINYFPCTIHVVLLI